ncbi:phosphotriesterase-related protein isoform X3 [Ahaetulla prasina]|uniref:phosphotriesterase-related protein isoform X3 n=1 Tax=Ahaetulla prasina TaxID=499056 RepID=UPI0026497165|nr:phosphotriesterase-related protein isoform X3 [Ahaetulla prasina]
MGGSTHLSGCHHRQFAYAQQRTCSRCKLIIKKTYFKTIKQEMSSLKGKIQTVLGLIEPSQLGYTMTHEHLTMGFSCCYYPPPPGQEVLSEKPIEMKHLFWLKQNPYSHKENLLLYEETDAVREELLHYKAAGGGSIVENTTTGIMRDVKILKQLSEETGVHVIAGAGFYVDATHSSETKAMTVEKVPMEKKSLQHRTFLSPPDTSTAERPFGFGPITSFFLVLLVLALRSSPVAYWTPSDLRGSTSSVISIFLFVLSMGFSWQRYWSGLPFPSPVDHVLSELSAMTCPSWVSLHSIVHSFIELRKPLHHDKAVIHERDYCLIVQLTLIAINFKLLHLNLEGSFKFYYFYLKI